MLNTSYSVVGKYDRDEMQPSITVAQTLVKLLDTTIGYLLDENEDANLFKDPKMLDRLKLLTTYQKKTIYTLL